MRRLHPQQRVRPQPKRLLEPDRHFGRQSLVPIKQLAHRLARDAKVIGEVGDIQLCRFDNLRAQPLPRMNREARMKLDRHRGTLPLLPGGEKVGMRGSERPASV